MKRIWTLLLLIFLLTGCMPEARVPVNLAHDQTWIAEDSYFGEGVRFHLASSPYFDAEIPVYWIESEQELALLLAIKFDQGIREIEYISETRLDDDLVMTYMVGLFVHDFEYTEGTYDYTDNDQTMVTTHYVQLTTDETDVKEVEEGIDRWTKTLKADPKDEKSIVTILHDQLITTVRYDDDAIDDKERTSDAFSAIGVFEDKSAVCNGYSQAYMGLLKEMDIPAILISSEVDDHAWNMVFVDGEWVFVDVTWNDYDYPVERPMYDFFLMDEENFYDHTFDKSSSYTLTKQQYFLFATYVFPQTAN